MKATRTFLFCAVMLLCAGMIFAAGQQAAPSGGGQAVTTTVTPRPLTVTPQYGDRDFYPQPATSYSTNPAFPQQPAISNLNGYPIVQNRVTMKVAIPHHSYNMEPYSEVEASRYMEELTNVRVDWDVLPEVGTLEKLNLMFASGEALPDVFLACPLNTGMQITLGQGKLIIPLQDLIEKHTFNFKKMMDADKSVYPAMFSADGNIYALGTSNVQLANQVAMRFWINQKFLDALGMKMPTTTDEYYQYLKAVKERDPNGNGKADEIPLVGETEGWYAMIDGFLMNAFAYNETSTSRDPINRRRMFLTSDGKIDVSYNKAGWREGLEYLTRLCAEGLLAPESFTLKKEELRALVEIAGDPIVGSLPNGGPHEFANTQGERRKDFVVVPPLKGPKGVQQCFYDQYNTVTVGRFAISKDCKIPEIAIKWVDYLSTPDWWTRNRYGVLGRDWKIPPAGTESVRGGQAMVEEVLRWGTPQKVYFATNFTWPQFASYDRANSGDPYELEYVLWNAQVAYAPFRFMQSVPRSLTFTVEESRDFTQLNTLLVEYIEQFMAQVVTGRIQLNDTTWNNYVNEINRMGLPRLLQVSQSAFDRSWAQALGYKK